MPESYTPSEESLNFEAPRTDTSASATTETPLEKDFQNVHFDTDSREIVILSEGKQGERRHPFQEFMYGLRDEGVRVSTGEWLDLQTLLAAGEVQSVDELYVVSRAVLVKTATDYPKYDTVFGQLFYGIEKPIADKDGVNDEEQSFDYSDGEQTGLDQDSSEENEKEDVPRESSGEKREQKDAAEKSEQKEKENIQEVKEAPSETSEEAHGGNEATKDIEDSPNAANEGQNEENRGAESGKPGEQGTNQGSGGKRKTGTGSEGSGGNKQSGKGEDERDEVKRSETDGESKDKNETTDKGTGAGRGKGKRNKSAKPRIMKPPEKNDYESAKEEILERRHDELSDDRTLGYEQFAQALSKLRTIVQETTTFRTHALDERETVRNIAKHGGSPELLWKEEVEEKPSVVLLFDVGGTTDPYRPVIEKLFSAAKDSLEGVEVYYFHNAIYGEVWPQKDGNFGKHPVPLSEIIKKDPSTKVIIVVDACMAENDNMNGGLYDSYLDFGADTLQTQAVKGNKYYGYSGLDNFKSLAETFPGTVFINCILEKEQERYDDSGTIADVRKAVPMYDLSLRGVEQAVRKLMEG